MTAPPIQLLVVEDDAPIRRFLRGCLATQEYQLLEAVTAAEGLALAASHGPDLILLDLGLPDRDGLDVLRALREWSQVPVIVLSARGQERDKIAALDGGADDYLTKPFAVGELLARIRAALRRASAAGTQSDGPGADQAALPPRFAMGDVQVDLERRLVTRAGRDVHLTPIEFKLLVTLYRHDGRVLTHQQLLREVWGGCHVGQTHYPRVFMHALRRKIESDPARPRFLITESGVGYRLRLLEQDAN